MVTTTKTSVVHGKKGGFMITRGAPRYQSLEGRHYVVGRGSAHECESVAEAYALRDRLLKGEADKHAAAGRIARKPPQATAARVEAAPQPSAPQGGPKGVGARVAFAVDGVLQQGRVAEVGARSLGIEGDDGAIYRRAPGDVREVA